MKSVKQLIINQLIGGGNLSRFLTIATFLMCSACSREDSEPMPKNDSDICVRVDTTEWDTTVTHF